MRKSIAGLKPYAPNLEASGCKMDANENPYDIPADVKKEMLGMFMKEDFNRYPDPVASRLKRALSAHLNVRPESIVFGNGSDEIIACLIQAYAGPGDCIVVPSPTFVMYELIARAAGVRPLRVEAGAGFGINPEMFIKAVSWPSAKLSFIASPNNPTGVVFNKKELVKIIEAARGIVVIDEAYFDFSGETLLPLLKKYKNLAVLRTFSKSFSMAGLRLGYIAAGPDIIEAVNRVRLPYNVNMLTQEAAIVALKRSKKIEKSIKVVIKERERMYNEIKGLYDVPRSSANFFYIKVKDAAKARRAFAAKGISVRAFTEGPCAGRIRLTVGKPAENNRAINILKRGV
ncbi:MAG TPA: histidinol-phosphate transaminase [bacterium]|mgnify:CR=1 FL=1|nr:histidinol-phosphate transaminase [bacterium]